MNTKVRIKVGDVEVEYDGDEAFLKQELPKLLNAVMELRPGRVARGDAPDKGQAKQHKAADGTGHLSLTTNGIAAHLDAKSGSDLLEAAAARLVLVEQVEPFSRSQLLEAMKSATSYYSKNHASNLSRYIKQAIQKDGPLSERAKNSYALSASARKSLEQKLADA